MARRAACFVVVRGRPWCESLRAFAVSRCARADPSLSNKASFGEGGFVNWIVGDYVGTNIDAPVLPNATWPALNNIPASFGYFFLERNGGMLAPSVVDADGIYTVRFCLARRAGDGSVREAAACGRW